MISKSPSPSLSTSSAEQNGPMLGQVCGPKDQSPSLSQGFMARIEGLKEEAHWASPSERVLGLSMEAKEGNLSPKSSSLRGCGKTKTKEAEDGDGHEDIPTTATSFTGKMTKIEELENLEEDPLQRHKPLLSHFSPSPYSSSSSLDRNLILEGHFGQKEFLWMEKVVELRVIPHGSLLLEPWSSMTQKMRGLEEVPVLLEDTIIHQEEQEEGTWEESCLLLFSKFLGFSIAEYKDEIFKLMNKICERRTMVKGKGVQGTTKFDKELKKLEWNVQEKEKSRRGSSSQSGKGEHSGW